MTDDDYQPHSGIYQTYSDIPHVITMSAALAEALDALLWEVAHECDMWLSDEDSLARAFDAVLALHDCRRIKLGGAKR